VCVCVCVFHLFKQANASVIIISECTAIRTFTSRAWLSVLVRGGGGGGGGRSAGGFSGRLESHRLGTMRKKKTSTIIPISIFVEILILFRDKAIFIT